MTEHIALVTNAMEFAGPAAVAAMRSAGFRVAAHDRQFADPSRRAAFDASHVGARALAAQQPNTLLVEALADGGELAALISNDAWPVVHAPVATAAIPDLRDTLEQLVVFPFALLQAAIPALRASHSARVVLITSSRTRLQQVGGAIPDIARDGVNALVKSLALELAPDGIPVNAIAPNFFYSETYFPRARFADHPAGQQYIRSQVPIGRLGEPEEMAELIGFLATLRGNFLTGSIIDFTGGWPAAMPRPSVD